MKLVKSIIILSITTLTSISVVAQEGRFSGIFIDAKTQTGIMGVVITDDYGKIITMSGINGKTSATTGMGKHTLHAKYPGYPSIAFDVIINLGAIYDFGTISLMHDISWPDINLHVVYGNTTNEHLEYQAIQNIPNESASTFYKTVIHTFQSMPFKIRGYDQRYRNASINGFIINDTESGIVNLDNIGGLTDVILNAQDDTDPGYIGLFSESIKVNTRASKYKKGFKAEYSYADETYKNKVAATYSTGLLANNWAFTSSYSHRSSQHGYKQGTPYNASSLFIAIEKKINDNHDINLTILDAIYKKGIAGATTQEVYDMMNDNCYNPYWGYQNGKIRNSKTKKNNEPLLTLSHNWNLSENIYIQTNIGYLKGRSEYTSLNWHAFPNTETKHIDWDNLYSLNKNNCQTIENIGGVAGNNITGNRSEYIVAGQYRNITQFQFNTSVRWHVSDNFNIKGGISTNRYKGYHSSKIDDLLGGDYLIDTVNSLNIAVYEGGTLGTDYTLSSNNISLYGTSTYAKHHYTVYLSIGAQNTAMRRESIIDETTASHQTNKSGKITFPTWSVKLGGSYKINDANKLSLNSLIMTNSPLLQNSFIAQRYSNNITPELSIEHISSVDINYSYTSNNVTGEITAYYTVFNNLSETTDLYTHNNRSSLCYNMTNIDKKNYGIELSVEVELFTGFSIKNVASIGEYLYSSNPDITIVNNHNYREKNVVSLRSLHQGGTPQTAISTGATYKSNKHWEIELNGSYYNRLYFGLNPLAHTVGSPLYENNQAKADAGFLLDMSVGKAWAINYKYFIILTGHFNNILNNTKLPIGGYEQPDLIDTYSSELPIYLYYHPGFTYYLNLCFQF